jgi:hypothetical protein
VGDAPRSGEGQPTPDLRGKTDRAEEGDETGQAAEGGDGLGRFVEKHLGVAEEGGNFRAGRLVRGRVV